MGIEFIKKAVAILILFVTALFSGGCSTVMMRPFPDMNSSLKIGVTDKHANEDDWAESSYHLDKTNVCFSKGEGEKGADTAQVLFGIIGRAVAVGDTAGSIKKLIKNEEATYSLDLASITQACLKKELESSKDTARFSTDADWKTAPLQITPYAVFSFVDEVKAKLWVVLRVAWFDETIKYKKWNCRYIVGLGDSRPLTGETGWTSNQGKLLKSTVNNDTHTAVRVMLDDLQGKLRSTTAPMDYIGAQWVFYKDPRFVEVQKLKTTDNWDVYLPKVEDEEYFAGINVVPKTFSLPLPMPEKGGGWGH